MLPDSVLSVEDRHFLELFLQAAMQAGPDDLRAGEAHPRCLASPLLDLAIERGRQILGQPYQDFLAQRQHRHFLQPKRRGQ